MNDEMINIKKVDLIKKYKESTKEGKELLKKIFGEQEWMKESIMERVKSFEDACNVLGINCVRPDMQYCEDVSQHKSVIAFYKLSVIRRALNEGWSPNWSDNEKKWLPYFDLSAGGPAGVAARFSDFGLGGAWTYYGSRLCLKSEELAIYFGKQFIDLWNYYLLEE